MAALVCILYSVSVDLYRVGRVFIESGGSIGDCLNYLQEKREIILIERYLEHIDTVYRPNSALCSSNGIECINCRRKSNKMSCGNRIINTSNEDFIEIERGHEAIDFTDDYDSVSMWSGESFKLFCYCDSFHVFVPPYQVFGMLSTGKKKGRERKIYTRTKWWKSNLNLSTICRLAFIRNVNDTRCQKCSRCDYVRVCGLDKTNKNTSTHAHTRTWTWTHVKTMSHLCLRMRTKVLLYSCIASSAHNE